MSLATPPIVTETKLVPLGSGELSVTLKVPPAVTIPVPTDAKSRLPLASLAKTSTASPGSPKPVIVGIEPKILSPSAGLVITGCSAVVGAAEIVKSTEFPKAGPIKGVSVIAPNGSVPVTSKR